MYDGLGDYATPAQRERLAFLTEQLHAIGVSIGAAQSRGDLAAVERLRALAKPLQQEEAAIRAAITRQTNAGVRDAETNTSGALQPLVDALKGAGLAAAVGLGIIAFLTLKGRRSTW